MLAFEFCAIFPNDNPVSEDPSVSNSEFCWVGAAPKVFVANEPNPLFGLPNVAAAPNVGCPPNVGWAMLLLPNPVVAAGCENAPNGELCWLNDELPNVDCPKPAAGVADAPPNIDPVDGCAAALPNDEPPNIDPVDCAAV